VVGGARFTAGAAEVEAVASYELITKR
jgi:hypothetical protein